MPQQFWLVKQEPTSYAWSAFLKDGRTAWTGVRNYQARIHLRGMKVGDLVAYYHSGDAKEIVGIARVAREAYPDPTADEGDWSCVDLAPVKALESPVSLPAIRADPLLRETALVRHTRLSVMPFTPSQFERLLKLAKTTS